MRQKEIMQVFFVFYTMYSWKLVQELCNRFLRCAVGALFVEKFFLMSQKAQCWFGQTMPSLGHESGGLRGGTGYGGDSSCWISRKLNQTSPCCGWWLSAPLLSCARLYVTPWAVACQAPLSKGFPRQEYWSGLLFLPPGDPPDSGIDPASPVAADTLPLSHLGSLVVDS